MRARSDPGTPHETLVPIRGKKLVFHGSPKLRGTKQSIARAVARARAANAHVETREVRGKLQPASTAGPSRMAPIKPPMKVRKGHSGKAIVLPGSRMKGRK